MRCGGTLRSKSYQSSMTTMLLLDFGNLWTSDRDCSPCFSVRVLETILLRWRLKAPKCRRTCNLQTSVTLILNRKSVQWAKRLIIQSTSAYPRYDKSSEIKQGSWSGFVLQLSLFWPWLEALSKQQHLSDMQLEEPKFASRTSTVDGRQ